MATPSRSSPTARRPKLDRPEMGTSPTDEEASPGAAARSGAIPWPAEGRPTRAATGPPRTPGRAPSQPHLTAMARHLEQRLDRLQRSSAEASHELRQSLQDLRTLTGALQDVQPLTKPVPPSRGSRLTRQEHRIALMVASGMSNCEIAATIHLSAHHQDAPPERLSQTAHPFQMGGRPPLPIYLRD